MTPIEIVNAMETLVGQSGDPRQLRDLIEQVLLESGMPEAGAAELVDRVAGRVGKEIAKRHTGSVADGDFAVLQLRGAADEIVHGSSFVFSDDPKEVQLAKNNRLLSQEIFAHLQGLTFSEFEDLGSAVLKLLGCSKASVTPHAGDQGIDFYGEVSLADLRGAGPAFQHLLHETRFVIVGQAKHYPNTPIGPATVRELVGALSLARTETYSKDHLDLLGDVCLRPFTPVLACLFSTGRFTKGALFLAQKAGVIAFSGRQLSVFLADCGVGLIQKDGSLNFDASCFSDWLLASRQASS